MRGFMLVRQPGYVYNWTCTDFITATMRAFGLIAIECPDGHYEAYGRNAIIGVPINVYRYNLQMMVNDIALSNAEAFRGILI